MRNLQYSSKPGLWLLSMLLLCTAVETSGVKMRMSSDQSGGNQKRGTGLVSKVAFSKSQTANPVLEIPTLQRRAAKLYWT